MRPRPIPENQSVIITPYRDGPLIVRGRFRLQEADGGPGQMVRGPVALCRCGKSRTKPFCDGTHKLIGFRTEPEPPGE
jgi:CDGSH-type Zn-finger protein